MGQILLEDKIGTLSHSSGIISLTASRLTIGGQQYNTSVLTRTISDDVTLSGYNLYMVYAVVSGGSVYLRTSINYNSIGPSGFSAWKLVGCFHTQNGAFAGFLDINRPDSRVISAYISTNDATSPHTLSSTGAVVIFPTIHYDSVGGYNNSTGYYTVKIAGFYKVKCTIGGTTSGTSGINSEVVRTTINMGASRSFTAQQFSNGSANQNINLANVGAHYLNVGESIFFAARRDSAITGTLGIYSDVNNLVIEGTPGPSSTNQTTNSTPIKDL